MSGFDAGGSAACGQIFSWVLVNVGRVGSGTPRDPPLTPQL